MQKLDFETIEKSIVCGNADYYARRRKLRNHAAFKKPLLQAAVPEELSRQVPQEVLNEAYCVWVYPHLKAFQYQKMYDDKVYCGECI